MTETLATPRHRWFRFSLRTMLVVLTVVAAIGGVPTWIMMIKGDGPIVERGQWPEPLQALLAQASSAHLQVEPVHVYCKYDFDKYYFCRLNGSPGLVALMKQEWGLRPGTQDHEALFLRDWPRWWEYPTNTPNHQTWLANWGNKSDCFIVLVDNGPRSVVYVYHYFNF